MSRFWLAIGLALMLVATACGGSDSDVSSDAGADTSSTDDSGSSGAASDDDGDSGAASDGDSSDGGDDDTDDTADEPAEDDEPEPDDDFSGSDGDDFCGLAEEFDENDPFEGLTPLDGPAFADAADETWGRVMSVVPDEIRSDVEVIRDNFFALREIGEKYDWNFFSEEASTELEALDTPEMDEATARFDAYLEDVCGITSFVTEEEATSEIDIDPTELTPEQIETSAGIIAQISDLDIETAECLVEELGDFSDGAVDFDNLNEPVCGTTLNEVLFGAG